MSSKGGSKRLPNGLTPKENGFKNKVIEQIRDGKNPNGTQAVLEVYDTNDPLVAKSIAHENFAKPHIKKSIQDELNAAGLSRGKLIENLGKVAGMNVEKASAETVVKVNLELLKLTEPRKGEGGGGNTINIMNISFTEAKKQLQSIGGEADDFISEAE